MGGERTVSGAIPFPAARPTGFEPIGDEPVFDPDRHLAIGEPEEVVTLSELGYSDAEIAPTATPVALSSPFRVLSDEGAAVLLDISRRLRRYATPAGNRIEHVVRGGCYRSTWLRDLCCSPEVTAALSSVYGTEIAPHTMPHHLGHLNYSPSQVNQAVDKWHHDTIALDYVMPVTDPRPLPGGRFEYFVGTKQEMAELASHGTPPPPDRVVAPDFGGPGWVVALHGNMVVHRGAALTAPAERTTMVNAYVALDTSGDDQTRSRDLIGVDDPHALYTEWARHAAWRARSRLDDLIATLPFDIEPAAAVDALRAAVVDVAAAIADIEAGPKAADHYERGGSS